MAAPSQKQLKTKILELAKRKNHVDQPGRLVAHIVNELKLTSNSTIREPIIMALESLEEDKLITIGRNGTVMNSMTYIKPKPARTTSPKTPTRQRATATAAKQPTDRLPATRSRRTQAVKAADTSTALEAATVEAVEAPTMAHEPPLVELMTSKGSESNEEIVDAIIVDDDELGTPAEDSLFARLVEKAEKLQEELQASQQQTADANATIAAKDEELAAAGVAAAQAQADISALSRELGKARDALSDSSEMNELLSQENQRLTQANGELQERLNGYQRLETRALRILSE